MELSDQFRVLGALNLGRPQTFAGHFEEHKVLSPLQELESQIIQPHSLVTVLTELTGMYN
jgi:hypothetical protein